MTVGPRTKVFLAALGLVLVALGILYGLLRLNSPSNPTEALLARVIDEAEISDHFDWNGGEGWDSEDVTNKVCHRVDVAALQKLGMAKRPVWPTPANGEPSRPTFVWEVTQDKDWQDVCGDQSIRRLRIEIDAETLVCRAIVTPFPACDL